MIRNSKPLTDMSYFTFSLNRISASHCGFPAGKKYNCCWLQKASIDLREKVAGKNPSKGVSPNDVMIHYPLLPPAACMAFFKGYTDPEKAVSRILTIYKKLGYYFDSKLKDNLIHYHHLYVDDRNKILYTSPYPKVSFYSQSEHERLSSQKANHFLKKYEKEDPISLKSPPFSG